MDPSEWIQWTQSPNLVWRVNISLVFLSNESIVSNRSVVSFGSIEHHWTCPLYPLDIVPIKIVSLGHYVHWKQCPLDPLCPLCPLVIVSIGSIVSIGHSVHRTLGKFIKHFFVQIISNQCLSVAPVTKYKLIQYLTITTCIIFTIHLFNVNTAWTLKYVKTLKPVDKPHVYHFLPPFSELK